ncbi:hypothetical protein MFIFM68171_02632 [Madurella fahalii]|uniref:Kelch repeat protein n=1 Tax=Madurella fahalii TaxID=1157608 RepID=A0ABQ0G3V2_9PEZI
MRCCRLPSGLIAALVLGCAARAALQDVPALENFLRIDGAKATVLGSYVYVDGGEISQLGREEGDRGTNRVNSKLSIDISKSWTAIDVETRTIPNPGPKKVNVVLWTDSETGVFYSWGGGGGGGKWVFGSDMAETELWRSTADGSGGGMWSVQPSENPGRFNSLHPTEFGAFASAHDLGPSRHVGVQYEDKALAERDHGVSPFDTLAGASAQYVPAYGPNGLVMTASSPPVSFENVTFFDPQTKRSHWLVTTGSIPPSPRSHFCTAGFQNSEGGYDIFLLAGLNQRDRIYYEDAYILSLPGFRKLEKPGSESARSALFDMTAVEWKHSYDSNAAAYDSPDVVKEWYRNGSLATVQWSSDEVRRMFAPAVTSTAAGEGTSTPTSTSPTSTPNSPAPGVTESGNGPVGAIVGRVVGGVAGLAAVAVVAWLLIRRTTRTVGGHQDLRQGNDAPDLSPNLGRFKRGLVEVDGSNGYVELVAMESSH